MEAGKPDGSDVMWAFGEVWMGLRPRWSSRKGEPKHAKQSPGRGGGHGLRMGVLRGQRHCIGQVFSIPACDQGTRRLPGGDKIPFFLIHIDPRQGERENFAPFLLADSSDPLWCSIPRSPVAIPFLSLTPSVASAPPTIFLRYGPPRSALSCLRQSGKIGYRSSGRFHESPPVQQAEGVLAEHEWRRYPALLTRCDCNTPCAAPDRRSQ